MYTAPPDLSVHVWTKDCSTASKDFSGRGVYAHEHTQERERERSMQSSGGEASFRPGPRGPTKCQKRPIELSKEACHIVERDSFCPRPRLRTTTVAS